MVVIMSKTTRHLWRLTAGVQSAMSIRRPAAVNATAVAAMLSTTTMAFPAAATTVVQSLSTTSESSSNSNKSAMSRLLAAAGLITGAAVWNNKNNNTTSCCGIVGVVGTAEHADAREFLLDGLTILKNRGYDSAGIATVPNTGGEMHITKFASDGDKADSIELVKKHSHSMGHTLGIAHTRWYVPFVRSFIH